MNHRLKPTYRSTRSWIFIAFLALLVITGCTAKKAAPIGGDGAQPESNPITQKQVLIINSYHIGYKWTDDNMRGITDVLGKDNGVNLRVEYLDAKRINSEEYLQQVYALYQEKYANTHLDLIMSTDDAALNFLFKNAETLFPNVPVVFVGANFFDETRLQGFERFTGVSEEADVTGTLDLALSLHPDVKNIVLVNDTSITGQRVHKTLEKIIPQYPKITFELLEDVTMDEVRQRVSTLPADSLVLLTIFFNDKAGGFYEYDQFTSLISESSRVPVYGTWDFSLGYGIVGGKLTSGYTEGQRAANLALRVLQGEDPRTLPVEKQTRSQYLFDYAVLQKWDIDESALPASSIILNRPASFYEENKTLVWGVSLGFVILLFIIVLLAVNNNHRRFAQQSLAHSNEELKTLQVSLERRVAARTRDLAIVAEVGTATATILESKRLLQEVVDLTKERFNLYHSHIYLMDEQGSNLVLTAGAGEPGRIMAAEGRSIPLDREQSLVARAARERHGVTVNDVTQAPDFLPNPLLPGTRSELAVPMIVGGKVIGVFDIQSEQVGRFTESDVNIQATLAAQLATSIQNVRSFEQSKRQAELQSLINMIGSRIQRTTSIEETLQTAIRELGMAIGASRVKADIKASPSTDANNTASSN